MNKTPINYFQQDILTAGFLQNLTRRFFTISLRRWQFDALKNASAAKLFTEKVTGKKKDRPELMKLIDQLREGDIVVISELTRLSRSTRDLFVIVDQIKSKGADIKSLKET